MSYKKAELFDISNGAVREKVKYEAEKVMANIADDNTSSKAPRRIQVTYIFKPKTEERREVDLKVEIKTTLAPVKNVDNTLYLTQSDDTGTLALFENNINEQEFDFQEEKTGNVKTIGIIKKA